MAARAAIVGAGLMGAWHARYVVRAGAQVAAIVDPRAERAELLASRFKGTGVFATLEECLQAGGVDAVHVCTDRESHESLAEAALCAGAHVLVEKPMAFSIRAAQRLAEAAGLAARLLCPVHQFPFQHGFRTLLARRSSLGGLVRVEHLVHSAGGEGLSEDRRRSLLADIVPHGLSLLRALLGPALDGLAWQLRRTTCSDLDLVAACEDVEVCLTYSLRARPTRNELTVAGTQGTARVDLFHGFATLDTGLPTRSSKLLQPFRTSARVWGQAGTNLARRALTREPAYPGLLQLIRSFYASVRTGRVSPIPYEEWAACASLLEQLSAARG